MNIIVHPYWVILNWGKKDILLTFKKIENNIWL